MNGVRPVEAKDQDRVRKLVLDGMRDRWGDEYDDGRNADVDDILTTYVAGRHADVAVIVADNDIVAVGMLVPIGEADGQLVRMAVDRRYRGRGYGKSLVRISLPPPSERG